MHFKDFQTRNHAYHIYPTIDIQIKMTLYKLESNMLWTSCQNFS